ncbi:hypothetical protein [Halobellus sp. GM3]|uniref:hypothetical protein n=1 Tax=Halobellus sp. GM3 TaxID=3458410 RepID=UPI00403DF56C
MIGDSFWTPKRPVRLALLGAVLAMVALHQSELFGLMNSQALIFGWIPVQIAYDVAYLLVGTGILAVMYLVAPEPPAEHEATVEDGGATDSAAADGGEH